MAASNVGRQRVVDCWSSNRERASSELGADAWDGQHTNGVVVVVFLTVICVCIFGGVLLICTCFVQYDSIMLLCFISILTVLTYCIGPTYIVKVVCCRNYFVFFLV